MKLGCCQDRIVKGKRKDHKILSLNPIKIKDWAPAKMKNLQDGEFIFGTDI